MSEARDCLVTLLLAACSPTGTSHHQYEIMKVQVAHLTSHCFLEASFFPPASLPSVAAKPIIECPQQLSCAPYAPWPSQHSACRCRCRCRVRRGTTVLQANFATIDHLFTGFFRGDHILLQKQSFMLICTPAVLVTNDIPRDSPDAALLSQDHVQKAPLFSRLAVHYYLCYLRPLPWSGWEFYTPAE